MMRNAMHVWLCDAHNFMIPCMMHGRNDDVMMLDGGESTGGCTGAGGAEDAARAAGCC